MKFVPLSNGQQALVSDEDFMACLGKMPWSVGADGYAMRYIKGTGRKNRKFMYLHVFIAERIGLDCTNEVDHKDRNKLNNQRDNLRAATRSQNAVNREVQTNNTSGARGVRWSIGASKWCAEIKVDGKSIHLGLYNTIGAAEAAYLAARKEHFGEFG